MKFLAFLWTNHMDTRGYGTPAPALPTILSTSSGPSGFLSNPPPPEFTQRSSEAGILLESKTESAKAESEINTRMEHRLILSLHPRAPDSPSPVQAAYGYHSVVAAAVYAPADIWPRRRFC